MIIQVTESNIDEATIKRELTAGRGDIGAVVGFSGLVREIASAPGAPLTLEHYPGMTEKALRSIAEEATVRFGLINTAIIHRVGIMQVGTVIVYVAACSRHRQAAFDGANYMMDYLKTRAPFWKKEGDGTWVDARDTDEEARLRWE